MWVALADAKQCAEIEGLDVGPVGEAFGFNDGDDLVDVDFGTEGFVGVAWVQLGFDVDPDFAVVVAGYEVEDFFERGDARGGVDCGWVLCEYFDGGCWRGREIDLLVRGARSVGDRNALSSPVQALGSQ